SAGVGADIEVFSPLHDQRNGVRYGLASHLLAVHLKHAGAATADAAHAVVGERAHTEAIVLEVELQCVLAWRQRIRTLAGEALQIEEVIQKDRLILQYVKPVTAESAALRHDHAFGAACRDLDLGRVVE